MTTPPEDLIQMFSDGMMPTGADFSELIKSQVHVKDFEDHVAKFNDLIDGDKFRFGPSGNGWQVVLTDKGTALEPEDADKRLRSGQTMDLHGWSRQFGRIGAVTGAAAFASEARLINPDACQSAPSDGSWQKLIEMPKGMAAFEVVAASPEPERHAENKFFRFLRLVSGIRRQSPSLTYAVVTASSKNQKPEVNLLAPTSCTRLWRGLLLWLPLAIVAGLLMLSAMIFYSPASKSDTELVLLSYAGVVVVLSLRRCVQILTAARHDIRLRWHKSSGSVVSGDRTWDLWIKGPKGPGGGMIRYHITALWG